VYSAVGLFALVWGLKAVKSEDPKHTLYFAHIFFADHVISTAWTAFFAVVWWVYTPHDGRRTANSKAQEDMMTGGNSGISQEDREAAAMMIWNHEKGMAAAVIVISWLFKIYFVVLLYSYATHLRKGSYRSLPLSRPNASTSGAAYDPLAEEDDDIEDFYRVPLRTPTSAGGHRVGGGGSVTNLAEFTSEPPPRTSKTIGRSSLGKGNGHVLGDEEAGVLFDGDDSPSGSSRGSRSLSRG